jgi:hypothetical protein
MRNCSNGELIGWIIGTMVAVLGAGAAMYWLSGIPCGGGLWIAVGLVSAALTMVLAGIKPAFSRYQSCWGDPAARCTVSFSTIDSMITAVAGVVGATIAPLLVGAIAALGECITIPFVGIIISIATSIPIGAVSAAMLFGSVVLFGTLLWAVNSIQNCLSQSD